MWKGYIEDHLCWSTESARKRPLYRAPSWSWASVDGPVTLGYTQEGMFDDKYAHVIDADIKLSGQDPFGQVQSGVIKIACSLMAAGRLLQLKSLNDSPSGLHNLEILIATPQGQAEVFKAHMDCTDEFPGTNEMVYLLPFYGGFSGSAKRTIERTECTVTGDSKILKTMVEDMKIYGILLRPSGMGIGEYQRLGSFNFVGESSVHTTFKSDDKSLLDSSTTEEGDYFTFRQLLSQIGETTAGAVCAEIRENTRHSKERYVVHIS